MNQIRLSILFGLILFSSTFLFSQTFTVSFSGRESSEFVRRIRLILDEIENETGFDFSLQLMSLDRAKVQLLKGDLDLDFGRTSIVYGDDERVIYINPPLMNVPYFLYTTDDTIDSGDISTFRNKTLVIQQGDQIVMKWLKDNNIPSPRTVKDLTTAIDMLNKGRVTYFIESVVPGVLISEAVEKRIYISEEPLFLSNVYLVINSKHRNRVDSISRALSRLNNTGKLEAILLGSD